nr:antibiotic biosynthesis monooxygenase [Sodalis-like endosymbiont of Proechinophthirus fluctus]
MITIIVEIKVKPGQRETVLAAIEALRPNVLAEDGYGACTLLTNYKA